MTAGIFAASGDLNLSIVLTTLGFAATMGNTLNYGIGSWIGPKIFHDGKSRIFSREHIDEAHSFYTKYGAITLIVSRFLPIIRTLGPFVAGIGKMPLKNFLIFNTIGCLLWVFTFVLTGFFFGKIPFIKNNPVFGIIVAAFITLILLPFMISSIRTTLSKKNSKRK